MSTPKTTSDYITRILKRCGEPTNGNSSYITDALTYLNHIHRIVINGGNVFDLDVDETWTWAKSKHPIVLTLEPAYETGGVSITQGSTSGSFSSAPSDSLEGWFLKVGQDGEVYKIIQHTAGATTFQLDGEYIESTVSSGSFKAYKLDYEITPSYFYIDSTNNYLDFSEDTGTELSVSITVGTYTSSGLATAIKSSLEGSGTDTYTVSYTDRKFTISSNGDVLNLLGETGTNQSKSILPVLGFEDYDHTGATSYEGAYVIGGISRLVQPFSIYSRNGMNEKIEGIDELAFMRAYPTMYIEQGMPSEFCKIKEDGDGRVWVRFNAYPKAQERIEIEYVPVPRDLRNNSASRPLIPSKHAAILEYGASHFILVDKEDDKAQVYQGLASAQLKAMLKNNRGEQGKISRYFGQFIPRQDKAYSNRRRKTLLYGYDSED